VEVEPFFIEFWHPIWHPIWHSKAVFQAKSTILEGAQKRLSKGVQRPFKRRVCGTIFVVSGKWSKSLVFLAF
jgi:hypothetical protein